MVLAINAGFYNTKIYNGDELVVYNSKVQQNADGERTILASNGIYEVGEGYRSLDDKTDNLTHKLCTEYALLKYSKAEKVNLMVALPLQFYMNREYRERYRSSLIKSHSGIIDGVERVVTVVDCTVYAEGAAAYLNYKEQYANKVVGVLDFGGNTINCMIFERGKIVRETISTLDLGMIKLERSIIDAVNTDKLLNVQEYELSDIMKDKEYKSIVDRVIDNHMEQVKQRLIEKKWDIARIDIFATGGGVNVIGANISKTFKNVTVSKTGLFDNVLGLSAAGAALYGDKK